MKIKFTLLGTGSSMGVPRPDGYFGKCNPNNKKNYRTRCSALISFNKSNTLIDTSPDLRQQMLMEKITTIDNVLYTHFHADQTHGINDLRIFYLNKKKK
ncbi:MBL fold metallo-hydrolase, partial [Candidatus Pelagibacter sp.]|nr:MBL fold metallo-hydrolase [Candidatus Pelagibacter sp.]